MLSTNFSSENCVRLTNLRSLIVGQTTRPIQHIQHALLAEFSINSASREAELLGGVGLGFERFFRAIAVFKEPQVRTAIPEDFGREGAVPRLERVGLKDAIVL